MKEIEFENVQDDKKYKVAIHGMPTYYEMTGSRIKSDVEEGIPITFIYEI